MNFIYTYNSPLQYDAFRDACDNMAMMGIGVTDVLYAILRGIHHNNPLHFQGTWVADSAFDFPFEDDPDAEIHVEDWIGYLNHYYDIMRVVVSQFVIPLPFPPSAMLIADLNFEKMVVNYVP